MDLLAELKDIETLFQQIEQDNLNKKEGIIFNVAMNKLATVIADGEAWVAKKEAANAQPTPQPDAEPPQLPEIKLCEYCNTMLPKPYSSDSALRPIRNCCDVGMREDIGR